MLIAGFNSGKNWVLADFKNPVRMGKPTKRVTKVL